MIRINENYTKLKASYLFSDIAKRVSAYVAANPTKPVIRLGIGDVTEPLPPVCVEAMHAATNEMAQRATFKGYGPEQGYAFLREAVAANDYTARGCQIDADEIFISDGSKCDCGNIQEIFAQDVKLAIPDPVYPVYVDTNVMAGRTGANIDGRYQGVTYLDSTPANGYVPAIPGVAIYTDAGKQQTRDLIDFYLANAKLIREAVKSWGFTCIGGDNAPYLWINTGRDSWEFFDLLLNQAQVVCTPGAGFGKCGEGHVRISAFNSRENVITALARISAVLK